jgi:hypothetical protein
MQGGRNPRVGVSECCNDVEGPPQMDLSNHRFGQDQAPAEHGKREMEAMWKGRGLLSSFVDKL